MSEREKPPPYTMYQWLWRNDRRMPVKQWPRLQSGSNAALLANEHPDEYEIGDIARDDMTLSDCVYCFTPHPLAEFYQSRVYIEPLTPEEVDILKPSDMRKVTLVRNGRNLDDYTGKTPPSNVLQLHQEIKRIARLGQQKLSEDESDAFAEFKKQLKIFHDNKAGNPYGHDFHLGRKVDLNRECWVPNTAKNWDDVLRQTTREEVRDLYVFLKNNPELRVIFSLHEDGEFSGHDLVDENTGRQGGFYFYDTFGNAADDIDKELVAELRVNLIRAVLEAGFTVLNGADDPDDPDLNDIVENGYIAEEVENDAGEFVDDNSFGAAAVKLGRLGITKMLRTIVFEIPREATLVKKKILYDIIKRVFMVPFVARSAALKKYMQYNSYQHEICARPPQTS